MQTASLGPNELLIQSQNNDYCFFSNKPVRLENKRKMKYEESKHS